MPTNPFFYEFRTTDEENLVDDLFEECIQNMGVDMYYLKPSFKEYDKLLGESDYMAFTDAHLIETYISNATGYGGEGQFVSKFGIEIKNKLELIVSKRRYKEVTGDWRPHEGSIIFFPLSRAFFEILYVDQVDPFFPLGRAPVFKISAQSWNYSHEEIHTEEEVLDQYAQRKAASKFLDDNQDFEDYGNKIVDGTNPFGIKLNDLPDRKPEHHEHHEHHGHNEHHGHHEHHQANNDVMDEFFGGKGYDNDLIEGKNPFGIEVRD